ncbi:proton channel OtopLc-like isoform X2 [Gordionus sp. m RMFG-2023]|uniref:proton channel OtopLc-like isoform X2 n=1 Tax=Gordionus sp. m RMFG-2023 TaxID=3053472 RepID=UPI0031FE3058
MTSKQYNDEKEENEALFNLASSTYGNNSANAHQTLTASHSGILKQSKNALYNNNNYDYNGSRLFDDSNRNELIPNSRYYASSYLFANSPPYTSITLPPPPSHGILTNRNRVTSSQLQPISPLITSQKTRALNRPPRKHESSEDDSYDEETENEYPPSSVYFKLDDHKPYQSFVSNQQNRKDNERDTEYDPIKIKDKKDRKRKKISWFDNLFKSKKKGYYLKGKSNSIDSDYYYDKESNNANILSKNATLINKINYENDISTNYDSVINQLNTDGLFLTNSTNESPDNKELGEYKGNMGNNNSQQNIKPVNLSLSYTSSTVQSEPYLRAFGGGSMIYSGLQFSEFFDSNFSAKCLDILGGLVPAMNLLFTFIQTYFIFSHSKICIHKYKTLARFGLMHVVATNLCVWIITLVRQTIEEIEWYHHEIESKPKSHANTTEFVARKFLDCQKSKKDIIMSKIVEDAGPFLYPCTIEYSLICAAISYVMWKNIGIVPRFRKSRRARNSYTVNCEGASRGLFMGLSVLVFSIITLILFFVLIDKREYFIFAVYLNQVTEISVYLVSLVSIFAAFHKMRPLKYVDVRDREKLDSLLLSIAVAGEYFFATFSIVSAAASAPIKNSHDTLKNDEVNGALSPKRTLLLISSLINVIQSTAQTVFIVDALNRFCITEKDEAEKPGRQYVTFLIVCNFAMWAFNTFANERTRTNPIQVEFYGYITWNIITHICTPLSIFYRYHSTACLAEIWKQAYKTHIEDFV